MKLENENITLREYVESRLLSLDKQVEIAVANIKEATTSAFVASQKAIDKQEVSQNNYNILHNDLSRKMEEQYKSMIPRTEFNIQMDRISEDIKSLRESRSENEGRGVGGREIFSWIVAVVSIIGVFVMRLKI